ncbi:MAG TPA: hypothetical protein VGP62_11905 [Bryobacteraceae bacterium]|jgi:hypothetical protein|nr:hypothetical protein [Bryobacteraceae bacterium]
MKLHGSLMAAAMLLATTVPALRASSVEGPVPALPWLHEGMVLTFSWYAAVAAGNAWNYEEDGHGNWIDQRTGRTLSRTERRGTSGSGWNQITVVCIDGEKVVLSLSSFGNAGALGNNQPVPQPGGSSAVASVADPGDYWMDPNKLAGMRSVPAQRLLVSRIAWKAGDHTTNAIRVQMVKDGSYDEHIYDAKTGLCLHFAGSVRGAAPKYVGPGDMGQGDTTLTHGDFIGAKDISVPWAREAMPDWVSGVRALHYRGPIISRGPLPSGNSFVLVDLEMITHGTGWVQFASIASQQMQGAPRTPPSKGEIAFGRSQFGSLWAGPAALARLQLGEVLDEDPITKMQTVVAKADDQRIVIASRNAAGEIDSEYDRHTGMLVASSFYDVLSKFQRTLRLQGRE